jgi:hypothetical protein
LTAVLGHRGRCNHLASLVQILFQLLKLPIEIGDVEVGLDEIDARTLREAFSQPVSFFVF